MTLPNLPEIARERPVHFMGIAGAGMTPLADLLLRLGGRVTGCDAHLTPALQPLRARGATITEGHDAAHLAGCGALIVTSAVPADHPEVAAARERGIPVLKRAAALGSLVNPGTVVAIAGTHGKTTTTALTAAVLTSAGLNPTALIGARVPGWGGNLLRGNDALFVVEADEYDRSFLSLHPTAAAVTTLEADHLDIYGSLQAIEEAFEHFLAPVPPDGMIAVCADDLGAGRLAARLGGPPERVLSYGTSAGSMLRAEEVRREGADTVFVVRERGERLGEARLRAPGLHNVRNALAAVAFGRHFRASWDAIAAGLADFGGIERRFERVGEAADVIVVDDYAHHPTEVRATLAAARATHPDCRLVAVFQPHLFSRTRDFAAEFGCALALADVALVADVYAARERPIPGVNGALVADAARAAGGDARYLPDRRQLGPAVAEVLRPGDLCLTLGAGDLNAAAREILGLLRERAAAE